MKISYAGVVVVGEVLVSRKVPQPSWPSLGRASAGRVLSERVRPSLGAVRPEGASLQGEVLAGAKVGGKFKR